MSEAVEYKVGDRVRATITCPVSRVDARGTVIRVLDVDIRWPVHVLWDDDPGIEEWPGIKQWPAALEEIEKVTE